MRRDADILGAGDPYLARSRSASPWPDAKHLHLVQRQPLRLTRVPRSFVVPRDPYLRAYSGSHRWSSSEEQVQYRFDLFVKMQPLKKNRDKKRYHRRLWPFDHYGARGQRLATPNIGTPACVPDASPRELNQRRRGGGFIKETARSCIYPDTGCA